jgi:phage gp29-like protein
MIAEIRNITKAIIAIASGKQVHWTPDDRRTDDASRGLTPAAVDRIMVAANGGDAAELFRLAAELPEKNWDIFHALQTRRNAVLGCHWEIEPGDDSPAAKAAAEKLEQELRDSGSEQDMDSFYDLLGDLERALLPGVTVSEIIWEPGGSLAGFSFIEPHHLSFRDGRIPKMITVNFPLGIDLPRGKFIVHLLRAHGPDPVRGGLIRPLAWLHCFANMNVKDLLRFIERYGMPFTVAKVDQTTWNTELAKIKALIRSFGPDGGGVFTKSTEVELLQAANNTGDIYFRLLEYVGAAITKVVLGQTATSSAGGGFSKDGAQSDVRQDIKDADCRWLENTVNIQVAKHWAKHNYGDAVPAPRLKIDSDPESDEKAEADTNKVNAETVKVLSESGYELDDDEVSEKTGFKVTKKAATPGTPVAVPALPVPAASSKETGMQPAGMQPAALTALELSADPTSNKPGMQPAPVAGSALAAWLGPVADAINELSDDESSDKQFAAKLSAVSAPDKLGNFDSAALADVLTVQAAEAMKQKVTQASSLKGSK